MLKPLCSYFFIVSLFFTTGCASIDDSVYEAGYVCNKMFREQNLSKDNPQNKAEYIRCQSTIANAEENNRSASATLAQVITMWVGMGVSVIVGLTR